MLAVPPDISQRPFDEPNLPCPERVQMAESQIRFDDGAAY
jgi:hypothetical protein